MSRKPALRIDVVTLFPDMFEGPLSQSIIGRARDAGVIKIRFLSLRDWSDDPKHQKVDARPFGGGAGMVIQPEPVYRALKDLGARTKKGKPWVVFLSPQGQVLSQSIAGSLAKMRHIILLCGHYEGLDERIMPWIDQEISIGDYVLTGGEIPAMVLVDVVARLVPGVVGDPDSLINESFSKDMLDYPHYTRPREWRGKEVPDVLLSGHHAEIEKWRQAEALRRTKKKRPDLLARAGKKASKRRATI